MERPAVLDRMRLVLRAGAVLLESSVATSDVQQTATRLAEALDLRGCQVSVTLNTLTLSDSSAAIGEPVTMLRVVELGDPRLDRLIAVDELIADLERNGQSPAEAHRRLDEIEASPGIYPPWVLLAASLLSAAAWVVFAGGGWAAVAAGVTAALIIALVVPRVVRTGAPQLFGTFAAAFVVVMVPWLFLWGGLPMALTAAVAGGLYPLLPGGALVASITDGISGGVLAALVIMEQVAIDRLPESRTVPRLVVMAAAGVAVGAMGVARNLPLRGVVPVAVVGMLAWAAPEVLPAEDEARVLAVLVGGFVLGLGAQLAGRLQDAPAIVYTSTSVYVLVPGLTIYQAMLAFAQGADELGGDLALQALRVAAAIAAGVALGLLVGRPRHGPRRFRHQWRSGPRPGRDRPAEPSTGSRLGAAIRRRWRLSGGPHPF
jgi:uncharacterized membrane protein YjjP (DUF1212 family)